MKVYRCSQGHISTNADCPFCLKVQRENEEFFGAINEED